MSTLSRSAADGRSLLEWVGPIIAGQHVSVAGPGGDPRTAEAIDLALGLLPEHKRLFALRMRGGPAGDAAGRHGDVVVLAAAGDVRDGDMVVAQVTAADGRGATTLNRLHCEGGRTYLQPAGPGPHPLRDRSGRAAVRGKVVLVIRPVGPA